MRRQTTLRLVSDASGRATPYELTTLAQASRELRVVVLSDGRTDRAAAHEAMASGDQERFTWIEVPHFGPSKRREVLARLFA